MDSTKPSIKISPEFFKDLTWLIEKCDSTDEITYSDKDKYKYVIFYLKQFVATFLFIRKHDHDDGILEQHIKPNYVPFFKNPEFLFDDYIYHTPRGTSNKKTYLEKCKYAHYISDDESDSITVYGFLKEFEYIFYYVLNRIDEYDYEVKRTESRSDSIGGPERPSILLRSSPPPVWRC